MPLKMNLNLTGQTFTDEKHVDVGSGVFQLDHDWFWGGADLVINTASGGGGTQLTEGTDYQLSVPSGQTNVEQDLTNRSGKSVYGHVQIINAAYQTGDLYFSGKYIADSVDTGDWNIPLDIPQPWMKSLAATRGTTLHTGSANTDVLMALKDTTANFSDVAFGDVVENTGSEEFAMVLYKSGTDTLYLTSDIFPAGTEAYKVYSEPAPPADFAELTGALLDGDGVVVADTNTVNHLLDADGTVWTGLVSVGDWAMNLATGRVAKVIAVAAHDLTLQWDAFPDGDEPYMIFAGYVTIDDTASPYDGRNIPEMNISGRFLGGSLTAETAEDDQGQGHEHGIRATPVGNIIAGSQPIHRESDAVTAQTHGFVSDGTNGEPRTGEHTQPRTLRTVMIMRIK